MIHVLTCQTVELLWSRVLMCVHCMGLGEQCPELLEPVECGRVEICLASSSSGCGSDSSKSRTGGVGRGGGKEGYGYC